MESIKSFKKRFLSSITDLFNNKNHLIEKKRYLYKFFKKDDLKYISKDGFDFFIIPKQYYIWKGISINDSKNKDVNIDNKDTDKILNSLSSFFFADKETASIYGSKRASNECVDLQFKIVQDIVLIDISSINTIVSLFRYLKNMSYEELKTNKYLLDDYNNELISWNKSTKLKEKYPTEEIFFEKKWKINMTELITNTIGNYIPKRVNGKISSPETPTKVERKSDDFFDKELVKLICNIRNIEINGWIYFKENEKKSFHDEILICNPYGYIEYVDYHKI